MSEETQWNDLFSGWGTVLTEPKTLEKLPRCHGRTQEVQRVVEKILNGDSKSIVLDGNPGVGKTAIVYEVARELASQGWGMIEVRPSDLLVGTKWLGEWQTRINGFVESLRQPEKIVAYIPNIDQLDQVGKSSSNDSNAADFLAPPISRGELAVIGETSSLRAGSHYSLEKIMERMVVLPMSEEQTLDVTARVCQSERFTMVQDASDRLIEFSEYCGSQIELPGRVVSLVRSVFQRYQGRDHKITQADLLQAVSDQTGLRTHLLDDSIALSRTNVRSFFESKVLGQSEAIETATDLVMMIKAGLTDPKKPFNTMLFIGPTGVGKTEMARAIAEYCLGDASRVVRLDMSEYVTAESIHKLLGNSLSPGSLTGPVRERPFSIILLDEFEKASYPIFDLCLQLFDAGRLTDFSNQTVDFCRTIIILTSNLGSRIDESKGMIHFGFGVSESKEEKQPTKTRSSAQKAMEQFFRPEFLNRLDRVVHFVPLDRETIGSIARKELDGALDRAGIKRRKITIQIDPSIVPLLIDKGYSPTFGARPLKRSIEKMVLIPLAREIAAGKLPFGSTVQLGVTNGKIRPKVVQVSHEQESGGASAMPNRKQKAFVTKSINELHGQIDQLSQDISSLRVRRSKLLEKMNQYGTGTADLRRSSYDEIYRLEAIVSRYDQIKKKVDQHSDGNQAKSLSRSSDVPMDVLSGLMVQARIVEKLAKEPEVNDHLDVVLSMKLIQAEGARLEMVEKMVRMYQSFLSRLGFETTVLDDQQEEKRLVDRVSLLVSGPGVWMVLKQEKGTHLFRKTHEGFKQLEAIHVEVIPLNVAVTEEFKKQTNIKCTRLKGASKRIANRKLSVTAEHKPSKVTLSVVLDGTPDSVTGQLLPWLACLAETQNHPVADEAKTAMGAVVRRYDLGNRSVIRDIPTEQRWGHVDKALNGELERFIPWMNDETN